MSRAPPRRRNCDIALVAFQVLAGFRVIGAGIRIAPKQSMHNIPPSSQDPRTFAIIGAAYEVHRVMGAGFLELFYKDALAIELNLRGVPFQSEVPCPIEYKSRPLRGDYRMDFVCFGEVVLEIKARSVTGPADHAQVINYLASSKLRCGLLLNFGTSKLEHKRFIWEPRT